MPFYILFSYIYVGAMHETGFVAKKLELSKLFFVVFFLSLVKLRIHLNGCVVQAYTKLLMKKRLHVNASLATLLLKGKGTSSRVQLCTIKLRPVVTRVNV